MLDSTQPSLPGAGAQKPRIAYLLSRYPAISHTFFLKEVLGLRARGLDIHVASINAPDRPRQDLPAVEATEADQTYYVKSGGIAMQLLAIALRNPGAVLRGFGVALTLGGWDLRARSYALLYLAEALLIGQWMRHQSLGHLHVHFGGPVATVGMLTAQTWQVPWSMTLHGPDEFFDQEDFYLAQKIQSASFVICISDFCRSQVLRIAPGCTDSELEVVRLGVECTALQPLERSPGNAPVRLVCTGRLVAAKGHRILLEALAQAKPALATAGVEISCTFIGDGPERQALETLSLSLDLGGVVHFIGAQAHQPTLANVAQADIFVLASFAEGLPVALMEAMAMGVPCVSTTIAAIPELIHNGENGLLVSPANPSLLSEALIRLATEPGLRRELGQKARATVEAEYNLARNLDKLAATWLRRLGPDR